MADGATATTVDELYALPPEDFTAARDAAVKQAREDGDKEAATALKALRRPSVAAWLVNRLATEQADLLEQLLSLGPALAAAQAGGQADELRALGRQRRELVEAVADAAATGSGRPVSSAVREEVVSTLEAALADPSSAEAVRSGRLVRGLSYAGFGGVDLSGAVAAAPAAPPKAPPPKGKKAKQDRLEQERAARREAVEAAEQAAQEAAGRLDDAVRAAEQAEQKAADRTAVREAAEAQVAEALASLEAADRSHAQSVEAADAAVEKALAAVDAVREAQDQAERARQELDRLRREPPPACKPG